MLISIVIPVYNTKEYLRKCISSVTACDTADCEILLIDDGSTDGESPALCDEIAAERPDLIRVIHQENRGLGGARNTGIEAAGGEYLFFIDSDDTIVPETLTLLKREILRTGADIVSFDLYSDDGVAPREACVINAYHSSVPFTLKEHPEFLQSMPSAWSRVWKKTLFTQNGILFPERYWYEDIRTSTKLFACAESIVTLPEPLYVYYQREGSIMHSSNLVRNREILDAFEDLLGWYRQKGLFEFYRLYLCRLCIEHVLLAASVRVLKRDPKAPLLKEFQAYLASNFPEYRKVDLSFMPWVRRFSVFLLTHRCYRLLAWLFRMK